MLLAYLPSCSAEWVLKIMLPILVYNATGNAVALSISYAIFFVPIIIIAPVSSIILENYNKKAILIVSEVVGLLSFTFFIFLRQDSLVYLYLQMFIIASCSAISYPIMYSVISEGVSKMRYLSSNAALHFIYSAVSIVIPLLVGYVMYKFTYQDLLITCALLKFISLIFLLKFQHKDAVKKIEPINVKEVYQRITSICALPIFKWGCLFFFLITFATNIVYGNMMYYLLGKYSASTIEIGYAYSAFSIGALLGSVIAPTLKGFIPERIKTFILISTLLSFLLMLTLNSAISITYLILLWSLVCLVNSILMIVFITYRQHVVAAPVIGVITALSRSIIALSIPLASILGGILIESELSLFKITLASCAVLIFALFSLLKWNLD